MTPEDRAKALEEQGGFSVHIPTGGKPKTGHIASRFGSEMVTDNVATAAWISEHERRFSEALNSPETYQGGWKTGDPPKRYLDVSERFTTAREAHEFGRRNAQIAFYDLAADKERLIHYGPAVKPRRDISNPLLEHRAATARKNAAYRGTVRQHLKERAANPRTPEEIRAAGERIGHAVYNAEQFSRRLEKREI
jgi:hypothetical protein